MNQILKRKNLGKMKEHVDVLKDSFVDYAGRTHHFVIAAVTNCLVDEYEHCPLIVFQDGIEASCVGTVEKGIRIGISICNPEDQFSEKVGVLKAVARARNSTPVLYVVEAGYINKTLVEAFLKQEAEYLKSNPDVYIQGYNDSKERYLKRKKMESLKENFSEVEKIVVEGVQKDPKFLDNVNTYLAWLDNQNKGKCKKHGK